HLVGPHELSEKTPGYSPFHTGLPPSVLNKQLSNIAWATFFGELYSKEADFPALRDIGYLVEEFSGGYLILMSNNMRDVLEDFSSFSRKRVALKKHFRTNLFRITEEPEHS